MKKQGSDNPSLILVGKITAPHGIRGQVKVASYTQNPENITAYGPLFNAKGEKLFELKITSGTNSSYIASIPGITSRNDAEKIIGTELYVPRSALPETDGYYYHDLIGLQVSSPEGELLGNVIAVHNFGAGDLLEVEMKEGESEIYPFTHDFFPHIDIVAKQITLILPEIITTLPQEQDPSSES